MKEAKTGECYFCGAPAECREHVPPKCVFPDPKPTDLITVPSCKSCNETTKLDDEYFRWFVATGCADNPEAEKLAVERVLKRFRRKPALLESIMKGSIWVDVHSEGGIFLERRPGFRFDRPRVQLIITKMTKGLFRHVRGYRLGQEYGVRNFKLNPDIKGDLLQVISAIPLSSVGGGVFRYGFVESDEDRNLTMWVFIFFDEMIILSMTRVEQNGESPRNGYCE